MSAIAFTSPVTPDCLSSRAMKVLSTLMIDSEIEEMGERRKTGPEIV